MSGNIPETKREHMVLYHMQQKNTIFFVDKTGNVVKFG